MSNALLAQVDGYLHAMVSGALVALAVYALTYRLRMSRLAKRGLRSGSARETVLLLFAMYVCGMALLTLTPMDFDLIEVLKTGWDGPFFQLGRVSLEPLKSLRYSHLIFWGNVVMFLPFGFLPAVLWRGSRWYKALAVALCVPAVIESWQFFIGRTFDVDDLLLNAVGVLLGWLLWLALKKPTLTCEER